MKAELCSPGITPGKQSLQLTLAQPFRGFKVGDDSLEIMCRYANYFILLLA